MQNPENRDLQRLTGNGFTKRGPEAIPFLLEKLKSDPSGEHKANTIHVLVLFKKKELLPDILPFTQSADEEVRYKAIIVLSWIGDRGTIEVLRNLLQTEKTGTLRGMICSAMRQIYWRLPEVNAQTLNLLVSSLQSETDKEGTAIMIVVIQTLLDKKFGLKEDRDTGLISGDVDKARTKLLKAMS